MQGLRPALPPLPDGPCAMESHRPLPDQFKIVGRIEAPLVVAVHPPVCGQFPGSRENIHPIHMEQNLHLEPRTTARHGISILVHNDGGVFVHAAVAYLYIAEVCLGKRQKIFFSSSQNSFTFRSCPDIL